MRSKTKQMVYAALLIAVAIIIPIQFSFLRIIIPPFTATIASHVPTFIAMLISPMVAVVVGIGSALGFLLSGTVDLVVVCRAATHILVGYVGAMIILRKRNYAIATAITAPIHGIAEAIVVIPFVGFDVFYLLVIVCVGTIIHHFVDSIIAYGIVKGVSKVNRKDIYNTFGEIKEAA